MTAFLSPQPVLFHTPRRKFTTHIQGTRVEGRSIIKPCLVLGFRPGARSGRGRERLGTTHPVWSCRSATLVGLQGRLLALSNFTELIVADSSASHEAFVGCSFHAQFIPRSRVVASRGAGVEPTVGCRWAALSGGSLGARLGKLHSSRSLMCPA
jgi:hypothetical protein